jgi:Fic family protein
MDIQKFNKIINDKSLCDLRKLQYKYPDDFQEFVSVLKDMYYKELPLKDFNGNNLVYLDGFAGVNMNTFKLLMHSQNDAYGTNAVENEIISTAQIESIDYNRDSVRNILKGFAPKDEEENRIYGLKQGFDFISNKDNKITEENIYKLYMMTVGNFLSDENKLLGSNYYRHDAVYVMGDDVEHTGIDHKKLPSAMADLVKFINAKDDINDLARASIIHFYIAYLHPYFDGNGRMARLVHLWYLVGQGYQTTLFIPFSSYISKSRKKYYDAYTNIESNCKISSVIDVSPFLQYFTENVYNKLEQEEMKTDVFELYQSALNTGKITEKETQLWNFVISKYGSNEFSTKQLEKDFGNAAYATIRAFVLKFENHGLLSSQKYSNRVKYKVR